LQLPTTELLIDGDIELSTKEYRPKDSQWWVGVAGTSFFVLALVGSVALALLNPDGSFSMPMVFAIVFGLFWGAWTVLGVWIVADYYLSRLVVSREGVVQVGVFRSAAIEFDDVREARWRLVPVGGSLKLRDDRTRMTIEFARHAAADRAELSQRLRVLIPLERQIGWEEFGDGTAKRRVNPRRALVSSLLMAGFFAASGVLQLVLGPREWIQGPEMFKLGLANALGVALAGHSAWRAWRRLRAERSGAGEERLMLAEDASSEKRR